MATTRNRLPRTSIRLKSTCDYQGPPLQGFVILQLGAKYRFRQREEHSAGASVYAILQLRMARIRHPTGQRPNSRS